MHAGSVASQTWEILSLLWVNTIGDYGHIAREGR